jgi:hypothetical protein
MVLLILSCTLEYGHFIVLLTQQLEVFILISAAIYLPQPIRSDCRKNLTSTHYVMI